MLKPLKRIINFRTAILVFLYIVLKNDNQAFTTYEIKEESMSPELLPEDYIFALKVKNEIKRGDIVVFKNEEKGIIICGSGNGVSMVANKYEGVRAALCWNKEIASLSRQHNNANVLSLPARFLTTDEAIEIVKTFLETDFEGGRHERRVNKINK